MKLNTFFPVAIGHGVTAIEILTKTCRKSHPPHLSGFGGGLYSVLLLEPGGWSSSSKGVLYTACLAGKV